MIIEKILRFEVYPHDSPQPMTWNEATEWAASLGDGWRLPSLEELLFMYDKRNEIGGFKTEYNGSVFAHWYWSCTERRVDSSLVFVVDFTDGDVSWDRKDNHRLSSRVVRSVNHSGI